MQEKQKATQRVILNLIQDLRLGFAKDRHVAGLFYPVPSHEIATASSHNHPFGLAMTH